MCFTSLIAHHGMENIWSTNKWCCKCITIFNHQVVCKFCVRSKRNLVNSSHWICLSAMLLWFTVFFLQSHKEERFIFPAYPLICLTAAFTIEMVHRALTSLMPRLVYVYSYLVLIFVILFAFLSISRGLTLFKGE